MDSYCLKSFEEAFKFTYYNFGIRFHRYLYNTGNEIEFIETPNFDCVAVIVDGEYIQITGFTQ